VLPRNNLYLPSSTAPSSALLAERPTSNVAHLVLKDGHRQVGNFAALASAPVAHVRRRPQGRHVGRQAAGRASKPLLSSRDRQHQVLIRRAGKHDIRLSWIGNIRAPRITWHFPNHGADDHHMRPGLHPMLMG
jgi:hypothetical protein